jgi:hypothetical protein
MSDPQRARFLGYEIQHIFASEILTSTDAEPALRLLQSLGFDFESRSNKIALLRSSDTLVALKNGAPALRQAFADAGFGENIHDSRASGGNHPGYNDFNIRALNRIAQQAEIENWTPESKQRAVFDLHRFMTSFNSDGSIPIIGTSEAVFEQAWTVWRGDKSYTNLSPLDASESDS